MSKRLGHTTKAVFDIDKNDPADHYYLKLVLIIVKYKISSTG